MGLYDRDYMRGENRPPETAGGMLFGLIVINALIYLFNGANQFSMVYNGKITLKLLCQCFTAGFAHYEFGHIFFNMWGLYLFGSLITPHMSKAKFFGIYVAGALVGNLLHLACSLHTSFELLGASGAVYAMMAGAATMEPNRQFFMLFFPAPVKTTTLVIVYTLLDVLFLITGNDGIAHLAHIGGFVGGYIMMKIYFGNTLPWDPLRFKPRQKKSGYIYSEPVKESPPPTGKPGSVVSQKELDYLLDKLSKDGINSLSEAELERLRLARKQMRGD